MARLSSDTETDDDSIFAPRQAWRPCFCNHERIGMVCVHCENGLFPREPLQLDSDQNCDGAEKKVRKRTRRYHCLHGRAPETCKECGGTCICPHGRRKSKCKECGGVSICEHMIERAKCKACGGSAVCGHGRVRALCKACQGASICEHGKQRCRCKLCGGTSFCEHGKRRSNCKLCGGSSFCPHGKRKTTCRLCGGSAFCEHDRRTTDCPLCKGPKKPKLPATAALIPFNTNSLLDPIFSPFHKISEQQFEKIYHHSSQFILTHTVTHPEVVPWDRYEEFPVLPIVTDCSSPQRTPADSPLVLPRDSPGQSDFSSGLAGLFQNF